MAVSAGATLEIKDIMKTISDFDSFNLLNEALKTAQIDEIFTIDGPYTLFAPTNQAFEKLPDDAYHRLLDNKMQLTEVLMYHIIAGKLTSHDMLKAKFVDSMQGEELSISEVNGIFRVNNADILDKDIECSNGIIHTIGSVLIPG
jgi:uncharacterized surface protein with fasciclin (FAS1) repeats